MGYGKYILDENRNPVLEPDVLKWGRWFETSGEQRIVKQEMIGDSKVSTVFLGLDHRWGEGPPLLWETMVFGGKMEGEQNRYTGTWEQAEAMHERMVGRVKAAQEEQKGRVFDL